MHVYGVLWETYGEKLVINIVLDIRMKRFEFLVGQAVLQMSQISRTNVIPFLSC